MVKGSQKKVTQVGEKYVGFTQVEVMAVNPTRSQLNKLLKIEDSDDDKEIEYEGVDKEGNASSRISFWLYSAKLDKYFNTSFFLKKKVRKNKDETKTQYINSTCGTSWGESIDELPEWFYKFTDKNKEVIGEKEIRECLVGEEELANMIRTWLGRLNWSDPDTSVFIKTEDIFKGDYSELQSLIDGDFDTPFTVLLGVRTDDEDPDKQYQQVCTKKFLPSGFMAYIEKQNFKTDYAKKTWEKFKEEVEGEYGFNAYFELVSAKIYDPSEDPFQNGMRKREEVTPDNSKY